MNRLINECELSSNIACSYQNGSPLVSIAHKYSLSTEQIYKILSVLEKGNRVELIPCKGGIKIIQEIRKEIK